MSRTSFNTTLVRFILHRPCTYPATPSFVSIPRWSDSSTTIFCSAYVLPAHRFQYHVGPIHPKKEDLASKPFYCFVSIPRWSDSSSAIPQGYSVSEQIVCFNTTLVRFIPVWPDSFNRFVRRLSFNTTLVRFIQCLARCCSSGVFRNVSIPRWSDSSRDFSDALA